MVKNRFGVLLAALTVLLISSPVIRTLRPGRVAGLMILLLFALTLLAAVYAVSRTQRTRLTAYALAVPAVVAQTIQEWISSNELLLLAHFLGVAFLSLVVLLILKLLFVSKQVTTDTIFAALCAYLVMCVLGAIVYSGISILEPGSFSYALSEEASSFSMRFGGQKTFVPIYYSMITMSTLGYGDIVPVSPFAQMCAGVQAIAAQLYLAVLVARLVGIHVSQSLVARSDRH